MTLLLAIIYIVFISLGLPDSMFGVSWPVVHQEFGIEESFASVYSIIIGVCSGGVSFVAGRLIRKLGTGRVTFISTLLTVLGLVGISFSPNIAVMMVFSIVLGYGAGAIDTGLNNYVSLHYEARHMNWLHCFWGVGVTVSPIIMSVFLGGEEGSWRNGYRVVAIIQAMIALFVLFTLKKWNDPKEHTQTETGIKSDKKFYQIIVGKGVITSILSLGLYCSAEFILGTWGATYAVNVFAVAPETAAKWVSLYYGGIMLGRVIAGFVSVRATDNTLIKCGILISVSGVLILLLPIGTAALGGFLLIGLGFGPVFPSVLHSVPERFGNDYSADITGYHMGGAYTIGFAVQLAYGYVASVTTFAVTGYILIVLCAGVFLANAVTLRSLNNG